MVVKVLVVAAGVAVLAGALAIQTSLGAGPAGLAVDCDGSSSQVVAACQVDGEQPFKVAVLTEDAPTAGFVAYQAKLRWDDAVLDYQPTGVVADEQVWPDCAISARDDNRPDDSSTLFACAAFPVASSEHNGPLLSLQFVCIGNGDGSLELVERDGDSQAGSFFITLDSDVQVVIDPKLTGATITCTGFPESTTTPEPTAQTPESPTASVTPTSVGTVGATPTFTLTATATATPTEGAAPPTITPTGTPTATLTTPLADTPVPTDTETPDPTLLVGDANCDGVVNALDAALILQFAANLISELPCPGDANGDGLTNPVDAALVLQFSAGLIGSLPP